MAVSSSNIVNSVRIVIQDQEGSSFSTSVLVGWINEAQKEIARLKPDSFVLKGSITLASGVKQSLPAGAIRLIGISGNTGGKAVRLIKEALISMQYPGWTAESASAVIQAYMFDDADPKNFMVYPPATTSARVDAIYSAAPPDTTESGDISIGDEYRSAIEAYVLYKCFSRTTSVSDISKAAQFYSLFVTNISQTEKADITVSPNYKGGENAGK